MQPHVKSLLFWVPPSHLDKVLVDFGSSQEDILCRHGQRTLVDDFDRMVLLKPVWDVVSRIPAVICACIEEAKLDAASNQGTEVDPIFTTTLKVCFAAERFLCCISS